MADRAYLQAVFSFKDACMDCWLLIKVIKSKHCSRFEDQQFKTIFLTFLCKRYTGIFEANKKILLMFSKSQPMCQEIEQRFNLYSRVPKCPSWNQIDIISINLYKCLRSQKKSLLISFNN